MFVSICVGAQTLGRSSEPHSEVALGPAPTPQAELQLRAPLPFPPPPGSAIAKEVAAIRQGRRICPKASRSAYWVQIIRTCFSPAPFVPPHQPCMALCPSGPLRQGGQRGCGPLLSAAPGRARRGGQRATRIGYRRPPAERGLCRLSSSTVRLLPVVRSGPVPGARQGGGVAAFLFTELIQVQSTGMQLKYDQPVGDPDAG